MSEQSIFGYGFLFGALFVVLLGILIDFVKGGK